MNVTLKGWPTAVANTTVTAGATNTPAGRIGRVALGPLASLERDRRPVAVPLDGSALAERALPLAIRIARQRGASLLLVRVVVPLMPATIGAPLLDGETTLDPIVPADVDEARQYLGDWAAHVTAGEQITVDLDVRVGDPAAEVLKAVADGQAQLLVLATHGRSGLSRLVRGSVAEQVMRQEQVPVLLVRSVDGAEAVEAASAPAALGKRVLVPLDGSPASAGVLPEAARLAKEAAGEVTLMTVVPPLGLLTAAENVARCAAAQQYLNAAAAALRGQDVRARTLVLIGDDIAGSIVDEAVPEAFDLIAMSTRGRGGVGRILFGSVATRVTHEARVPVFLRHTSAPPTTMPAVAAYARF